LTVIDAGDGDESSFTRPARCWVAGSRDRGGRPAAARCRVAPARVRVLDGSSGEVTRSHARREGDR